MISLWKTIELAHYFPWRRWQKGKIMNSAIFQHKLQIVTPIEFFPKRGLSYSWGAKWKNYHVWSKSRGNFTIVVCGVKCTIKHLQRQTPPLVPSWRRPCLQITRKIKKDLKLRSKDYFEENDLRSLKRLRSCLLCDLRIKWFCPFLAPLSYYSFVLRFQVHIWNFQYLNISFSRKVNVIL